jgi:hypothetical protein
MIIEGHMAKRSMDKALKILKLSLNSLGYLTTRALQHSDAELDAITCVANRNVQNGLPLPFITKLLKMLHPSLQENAQIRRPRRQDADWQAAHRRSYHS